MYSETNPSKKKKVAYVADVVGHCGPSTFLEKGTQKINSWRFPGDKLEDDGVQKSEAGERVCTLPYTDTTYPRKLERYLLKINGTGR